MDKKHIYVFSLFFVLLFVLGVVISTYIVNFVQADSLISFILFRIALVLLIMIVLLAIFIMIIQKYQDNLKLRNNKIFSFNKARIDNLTQIYNFDYFINILQTIEEPFYIVMLDIDDFKGINNKFGSVIGDLVLKVVAKTLKENTRDIDVVARCQGDAFVIVLKYCVAENAVQIMERISNSIVDNKGLAEKNIRLKTSIGMYYVSLMESNEIIFRNTVKALTEAKNNNSNKIVIYNEASNEI
ncbi:MAG: GGDEF domain-containing protein [Eubacteriaceae bacterium]